MPDLCATLVENNSFTVDQQTAEDIHAQRTTLQEVVDCLEDGATLQFATAEFSFDDTVVVDKDMTIRSSGKEKTSLGCDGKPVLDIRQKSSPSAPCDGGSCVKEGTCQHLRRRVQKVQTGHGGSSCRRGTGCGCRLQVCAVPAQHQRRGPQCDRRIRRLQHRHRRLRVSTQPRRDGDGGAFWRERPRRVPLVLFRQQSDASGCWRRRLPGPSTSTSTRALDIAACLGR